MQVDVLQHIALRALGIFEIDMRKVDGAVRHLPHGVFGFADAALLRQHFGNAFGGLLRHDEHDEHHRHHHEASQNLEAIGQHRGELPDIRLDAHRADDKIRPEIQHEQHHREHAGLHERSV